MEAMHPDEFVLQLVELDPDVVMDAAEKHRETPQKPTEIY
jgi:hypothetical protein